MSQKISKLLKPFRPIVKKLYPDLVLRKDVEEQIREEIQNKKEPWEKFDPETTKKDNSFIDDALSSNFEIIEKDTLYNESESPMTRHTLDTTFWTTNNQDFNKLLDLNSVDSFEYITTKYDCEDFTFEFKSQIARRHGVNSIGAVIDYSGSHAYNVVIMQDGNARLLEPQSDGYREVDGDKLYDFDNGFILI